MGYVVTPLGGQVAWIPTFVNAITQAQGDVGVSY